MDVQFCALCDNVQARPLSVLLASLGVRPQNLVDKHTHGGLQFAMAVVVVRAGEAWAEPRRLRIWNKTKIARFRCRDLCCLPLDGADLETCVASSGEDFMTVEREENLSRVFARDFLVQKYGDTAWMECREFAQIENLGVDDDPL